MGINNWIKSHSILSFTLLTLIWSFPIWSLMLLYIKPGELMNNPPGIVFLFVIVGGFGPSISGIICTRLIYGKQGLKKLFERFRNWKLGKWWLATLIIPTITMLSPIIRWIYGHQIDIDKMTSLIIPGIFLGLIAGLMEEFGWRGFLLPSLLKKYSPVTSALILGLIWGGIWHGYADYLGVGGRGLTSLILVVLLGPVLLTAWSFVISWVYKKTNGSLLMSYFMHASISSSALIFGQTYKNSTEEIIWTTVSVTLAIICAIILWVFFDKKD